MSQNQNFPFRTSGVSNWKNHDWRNAPTPSDFGYNVFLFSAANLTATKAFLESIRLALSIIWLNSPDLKNDYFSVRYGFIWISLFFLRCVLRFPNLISHIRQANPSKNSNIRFFVDLLERPGLDFGFHVSLWRTIAFKIGLFDLYRRGFEWHPRPKILYNHQEHAPGGL